jgi:hypothetical protein
MGTGIFDYGQPSFGLADIKIATYNSLNSYGTAVDVPSAQLLGVESETVNATLEGDDVRTAIAAIMIGGEITVRWGSVDLDVLEILTGNTSDEYSTTPNRTKMLKIDNVKFPYIGICGKAFAAEGTGDTHVFIPKCKITDGFAVSMEYGAFSIPEVTMQLAADDEGYLFKIIEHETAESVVIPPAIP